MIAVFISYIWKLIYILDPRQGLIDEKDVRVHPNPSIIVD